MNLFSFTFSLHEYFFFVPRLPPLPHKFSNGPSLMELPFTFLTAGEVFLLEETLLL